MEAIWMLLNIPIEVASNKENVSVIHLLGSLHDDVIKLVFLFIR